MTIDDTLKVRQQGHFEGGQVHLFGHPLRYSSAGGLVHSIKEIFDENVYLFNTRNPSPHIIDAGANIGLSIIYFKRRFPDATIVAYEPDPELFAMLSDNVQHLKGVDLRRAAAWSSDTSLTFYSEGSLAGSTEIDSEQLGRSITVEAQRLRPELTKAHVDFLKIDIEGAETTVIMDIAEELKGVDLFFFEYHSNPSAPQRLGELLNIVREAGFRYVINGTHGAARPFVDETPRGFDLQLNVSCFREDR